MRIGLALSGGGALGAAHIGVLEELDKHDIQLNRLCGTSAGAIAGGLYASGGLPALHGFIADLEKAGIINTIHGLLLRPMDVLFADIGRALRKHIKEKDLRDFTLPFSCIATDLVTGQMCTLTTGDPIAAILASSAYPGVFPIQRINGRLLVDGGVTRNFPADVLRHSSELDFIIGSSIYMVPKMPPRQRGGKLSRLQTMIRSIDILVQESNNQQTALCDFSFIAPVEIYRQYDLEHVRNICELGRIYAHEEIDRLVDTLQQHGWENYDTASTQAA